MKKILSMILCFVSLFSLVACNGNGANVEYNIPEYENENSINIGIWNGSHFDLSDEELSNLKDAGINLLVGTYTKNTSIETFIDRCEEYDLNVIPDQRPWGGTVPDYVNKKNFLGYCVYDEPDYGALPTLKEMKKEYDEKMPNKMFFVNLRPGYSGKLGTNFENYINSYVNDCGLKMISYDNYSIMIDPDTDEIFIRNEYLFDFDVCSHYAKQSGIPLWYTLLTAGHMNYVDPTTQDLVWQMKLAMTYGSTYLLHYIYSSHESQYKYPIVDMEGKPTSTYYKVKEADAIIHKLDKVYTSFKWLGTSNVEGKKETTNMFDYVRYNVETDEYDTLEKATSTYDSVIGHFIDGNGNKGYMITNITNPYEKKDTVVKLTFNPNYKGVLIFKDGKEEIVKLTNNTCSVTVKSGDGVFAIPLKSK